MVKHGENILNSLTAILSPVKNDGEIEKTNLYLNWVLSLIENYQLEKSCSSEDWAKYNFLVYPII